MGSSPTKHVEVKTDLTSALASNSDSSATVESDEDGWIACPRCLQLLDDPRQSPGCRHPICRSCYAPDAECQLCGELGRHPPELLTRDEDAARRLARWRECPIVASSSTSKSKAPKSTAINGDCSDSDEATSGEEGKSDDDEDGDAGKVAVEVDGESSPLQSAPSRASLTEAEKILACNVKLLQRQLLRWADEAQRLDAFVADCHRAIEQEADSLRQVQRRRRIRAQQQTLEQSDALHKLRLGAERLRAAAQLGPTASASVLLTPTVSGLRNRVDSARQGALAWDAGEGDIDAVTDAEKRLARLREFASAAAADLLQMPSDPSAATRLRPAATSAKARRQRSLLLGGGRRRQPTGMSPVRELPRVHVWDVAVVRHTGSLCHRADSSGGGGGGGGGGGADGDSSDVRYCPAGGKWRPLPNPSLYCLLPASSRLLVVSPDGTTLGELRLSPRRPRGNLERLRCLGDRLFASEPEFVYVTDLSGLCLHVLSGFSWAMGLWPDPDRRRLLVVNGDRRCVEIFSLDSFSHEGSLCDDEFTDDLTGVCVIGNRILVADHTAYQLHIYRADSLQFVGRLQVSAPRFLDVDSTGVVYITGDQAEYHQVTVLDPANGRQFSCGFEGSRFGEFRSPSGLAVDEVAGEIYVCDFDNERVQVFSLDS